MFIDEEFGGSADRAEFKTLLLEAYQKKFDLVVFWRLDRFSREGALQTLKYLKELASHGVAYKFTEPYLDSLGSFGDVIVSMLATIAAQDLIKIRENTKAALDKKRAAGVKLGAPTKSQDLIDQVRRLRASSASSQVIARALKMSPSIVAKCTLPRIESRLTVQKSLFSLSHTSEQLTGLRTRGQNYLGEQCSRDNRGRSRWPGYAY